MTLLILPLLRLKILTILNGAEGDDMQKTKEENKSYSSINW